MPSLADSRCCHPSSRFFGVNVLVHEVDVFDQIRQINFNITLLQSTTHALQRLGHVNCFLEYNFCVKELVFIVKIPFLDT